MRRKQETSEPLPEEALPARRVSLFGHEIRSLRRSPTSFLLGIAREFGSDTAWGNISLTKIGPVRLVLLNHPEYIKMMFTDTRGLFARGSWYHMAKSIMGESLLTSSDGPHHRRMRRLAHPAFTQKRIAGYSETMVQCADRLCNQWREGDTLDFYDQMSRLTADIATRTLFGAHVEEELQKIRDAMMVVLENWNVQWLPLAVLLYKLNIPYPASRRLRKSRKHLDAIIYKIIAERSAQPEPGNDLLSMLAHASDEEGDGTGMTDEQLRNEVITFFIAGHETIATSLTWMWYLLARNPEVEARLMDEIEGVLGGRLPTFEDLPHLEYTRRAFLETMRLYPAIWVISRQVRKEFHFGPYRIGKNWQVLASPFVMHRNPKFYDDPERFDPDRWLPENRSQRPPFTYFPFGGGQRLCPGEPFAMAEGPLTIATLAQKWRPVLVPGHKVDFAPGIVLRPESGILMKLQPRTPALVATG